jgi:hypothetical protein
MILANLLATFLTITVVGVAVVGAYDALERAYLEWQRSHAGRAQPRKQPLWRAAHPRVNQRGATPTVARSPLH